MTNILQFIFGTHRPRTLTAQEAFAGILFGACLCDGDVADVEIQGLIPCLSRMELYDGYDGMKCDSTINSARTAMLDIGFDVYVGQCVTALPEELRETVYANACNIVLADGVYAESERQFIESLRVDMEIDSTTAEQIMEIIKIKNRG